MNIYNDPHGSKWTTMQADFRDTLAHVASIGGADLIATSPPYCDARTYGAGVSWTDADYASLGDAVFAALKPGGHALINVDAPVRQWRRLCEPCGRMTSLDLCSRCGAPTAKDGTERGFHPWHLQEDWAERVGFRVPDRLAFGRLGVPGAYHGRFRNDWEPLLWFQKPGAEGWFDRRSIAGKSVRSINGAISANRKNDGSMNVRRASGWAAEGDHAHRGTSWEYGHSCNTGAPDIEAENHPARWPFKLAEDIVRCFCPPGGLTVDPFCGAGTTGAAAIAHGRRFVGGDLYVNEKGEPWASVAHRIMVERTKQQSLFGVAR